MPCICVYVCVCVAYQDSQPATKGPESAQTGTPFLKYPQKVFAVGATHRNPFHSSEAGNCEAPMTMETSAQTNQAYRCIILALWLFQASDLASLNTPRDAMKRIRRRATASGPSKLQNCFVRKVNGMFPTFRANSPICVEAVDD